MRPKLNPGLVFRFFLCLLVLLGIQPLLRLPQEMGQLYLGVPLSPSLRGLLFVNPETSSHWPGIQAGLRARDRILAIDGKSAVFAPQVIAQASASRNEGDPVEVEVLRDAERLTLTIPLRRYHLAQVLELHGLWFLAGLTMAFVGWLLFRPPTKLMALALALMAGLMFAHGNAGYADPRFGSFDFYPLEPMWTYGYYLLGAVLVHLAWRFPQAQPTDRHISVSSPLWAVGLYGVAVAMGTTQELTRAFKWIQANETLTQVSLLVTAMAAVVTLLRLAWLVRPSDSDQSAVRSLAALWSVAMLLVLGIGIVPFWSSDEGMLLAQFLLSITVVYPLLLIYAVRQVELVATLKREVDKKQRWANLAQELQRFREEDLRRVAGELHDTVLNDLRTVEMRLEGLISVGQLPTTESGFYPEQDDRSSTAEVKKLWESMQQIKQQAERIMKGAKPLDFKETTLAEALNEALKRFKHMAPGVDVRLDVGPLDSEPAPAVREAMYWIALSALNNCREHAQASQVRVFVSVKQNQVQMTIRDDGVGFDVARVQTTGFGLGNMRARAAQVGAELEIESDSRGTTVRFRLSQPLRQQPIRVLVVEDSQLFVTGLQTALMQWADEVEIAGVVDNAQEALIMAKSLRPDIVLLDLRIHQGPQTAGVDPRHGFLALTRLVQIPDIRTVVMSVFYQPAYLRMAGEIGAWAFWNKDQKDNTLISLLHRVAAGERLLTQEQWLDEEKERLKESLTPRGWEALLYLEEGLSDQEIANRMRVSDRTAEKHVESLRGKLGVHSRLEALAKARELGLLPGDQPELLPPDSSC